MHIAFTSLLAAGTIAGAGLVAGAVGPVATEATTAVAFQEDLAQGGDDVGDDTARRDGPCATPGDRVPEAARGALGIVGQALDSLVEDGTLSTSQDQAVRDRVGEIVREKVGRQCRQEVRSRVVEALMQRVRRGAPGVAAEAIGIPTEELVAALRSGASIAEVAEENGVARATVTDALVAAGDAAIEEAAANGRVPEEVLDAIAERLPELADRIVDRRAGDRATARTPGPSADGEV